MNGRLSLMEFAENRFPLSIKLKQKFNCDSIQMEMIS